MVDIFSSAKLLGTTFQVLKPLWLSIRGRKVAQGLGRNVAEMLGIDEGQGVSFRVGTSHPTLERGMVHPDDASAFRALAGPILSASILNGGLELEETIRSSLNSNFVLIAAPSSETLSRLIFGYRQRRNGDDLIFEGSPLDLPFRWQEDFSGVRGHERCHRYNPGGATTSRPNWPIIDSRNYRERSIYPETHNDGFLRTDYLLVTKIPNFLTPGSLAGKTIISFGGTHGVATRATSLLLNSPGLMKRLVDDYHDGRSPHFQALFKATSIIHEPRGGSHAKQLSLEAFVPLSFDDVVLDESRRTVNARFTDWAAEATGRGLGAP